MPRAIHGWVFYAIGVGDLKVEVEVPSNGKSSTPVLLHDSPSKETKLMLTMVKPI